MSDSPGDGVSPMEDEVTLKEMWAKSVSEINEINPQTENWKAQVLPLARIKKIMKSEEFVLQELEKERMQVQNPGQEIDTKNKIKFMISQEAPMLMTKACELLIKELTVRAWQHTERNRRRTLQRADLHAAVGESEDYDFLIDIVPRVVATRQPASGAMSMPSQLTSAMQAANGGNVTNLGDGTQMPSQEQLQQQMQFNFLLQQMQQQGTQPQVDGTEQQMNLAQQQQQQQQQMQQQEQQSIPQPQWTDPQV